MSGVLDALAGAESARGNNIRPARDKIRCLRLMIEESIAKLHGFRNRELQVCSQIKQGFLDFVVWIFL